MDINATLIGELIAFAVFVIFCMKYVWPPLNNAIEARQKEIADGLAAADKASKELESVQSEVSNQLDDAKKTAAEIIEQANKRKSQILEESKTEAKAERQKILDQGLTEVETERSRARDELRKQVAVLAVAGAEKILERTIDKSAHQDILDDITAKL